MIAEVAAYSEPNATITWSSINSQSKQTQSVWRSSQNPAHVTASRMRLGSEEIPCADGWQRHAPLLSRFSDPYPRKPQRGFGIKPSGYFAPSAKLPWESQPMRKYHLCAPARRIRCGISLKRELSQNSPSVRSLPTGDRSPHLPNLLLPSCLSPFRAET
ncbi:MAG: hypothetical protein JWM99_5221 [Verrucomicrobiales bacterium]|nr:hypothetical protein [Verrucomicrobiales bacterium]